MVFTTHVMNHADMQISAICTLPVSEMAPDVPMPTHIDQRNALLAGLRPDDSLTAELLGKALQEECARLAATGGL